MRLLDESSVRADEIDGLGHLNVRFYMARALGGIEPLLAPLGMDASTRERLGATLHRADTYGRYHREQYLGAGLRTFGALLGAADASARFYFEVRAADSDDLAASFILELALVDQAGREPLSLSDAARRWAQSERISVPDHGAPRSISLERPRFDVDFDDLASRFAPGDGSLLGDVTDRGIYPEECDANGWLKWDAELMLDPREAAERKAAGQRVGPVVHLSEEGQRFGFAWLERRTVELERPKAGDRLRSVPAEIAIHRKARHTRRWIFNETRRRLIAVEDTIGVAIDLDARRAIEIPPSVRALLHARHLPEFA